jgi:hypothetical protein
MDTSLYDPDLDGAPPIPRPARAPSPKATHLGKKFAGAWKEHPFVEWVLGLSPLSLAAVGLSMGALVSTPIVISLRPDWIALEIPIGLILPSTTLWALWNWPVIVSRLAKWWNTSPPPRAKAFPLPTAVKPKLPSPEEADPDPRYRWLTASARRKIFWGVSIPFLLYINVIVIIYALCGLGAVPFLLGARYGPPEVHGAPVSLYLFVASLHGLALLILGIVWLISNSIGCAICFYGGAFWLLIGPIVALGSLAKRGWTGWDHPVSIVFDPLARLSLAGIDVSAWGLRIPCWVAWGLIGWETSTPGKPVSPEESSDMLDAATARAAEPATRPRLLPRLSQTARGHVLAGLTFLLFTTLADAATALSCLAGRFVGPVRGQLESDVSRTAEAIAVSLFLIGLSFVLAYLLIGVRGTRTPIRR